MSRITILKAILVIAITLVLALLFAKAAAEDRQFRQSELYRRAKELQAKSHEPDWIGRPLTFTEAKQRVEFLTRQESN